MKFKDFTQRIENTIEFAIRNSIEKALQEFDENRNLNVGKHEESNLLTTEEVMAYLKVSRCTINNMIKRDQLNPIKFSNRKNYFKKTDIEKMVKSYE